MYFSFHAIPSEITDIFLLLFSLHCHMQRCISVYATASPPMSRPIPPAWEYPPAFRCSPALNPESPFTNIHLAVRPEIKRTDLFVLVVCLSRKSCQSNRFDQKTKTMTGPPFAFRSFEGRQLLSLTLLCIKFPTHVCFSYFEHWSFILLS